MAAPRFSGLPVSLLSACPGYLDQTLISSPRAFRNSLTVVYTSLLSGFRDMAPERLRDKGVLR